ncbi:MAG TPA: hypothetical protein VJY35_11495, partial [Candidatus Eisenbacteria bacterium]|nr:hypothetical protein [Candidatus Eisenbacteria bacterium]
MRASQRFQLHAFRRLEGALLRRRLLQLDPRLRIELAVLGLLIAGFLFWQVRVPLDGMVRARGPLAGVGVLATVAVVLALSSAVLAGIHHARRLRSGPGGP